MFNASICRVAEDLRDTLTLFYVHTVPHGTTIANAVYCVFTFAFS